MRLIYFNPRYFDEISYMQFYFYNNYLKIKKMQLPPRFLKGRSRKLSIFTMGRYGNLLIKRRNFKFSPYFFCIFTVGISFSFKYMKTIVKSPQIMKFNIMFTLWFGPGIIKKLIDFPKIIGIKRNVWAYKNNEITLLKC